MAPDGFTLASRRSRASSLALSLAVVTLVLLALLTIAPPRDRDERERRLVTFTVAPPPPPPPSVRGLQPTVQRRTPAGGAGRPRPVPAERPVASRPSPVTLPGVIAMDLDSNDVGKIKGTAVASADGGAGSGDSKAPYGPGAGPGGDALYNAEWNRPPTDAELNGYLPPRPVPPGSWADIACRMVADYRVENCRALGESPAGSGLARAMRQAAWQFRVRPPRLNGKPQLGTWVRIHISWDASGVR